MVINQIGNIQTILLIRQQAEAEGDKAEVKKIDKLLETVNGKDHQKALKAAAEIVEIAEFYWR